MTKIRKYYSFSGSIVCDRSNCHIFEKELKDLLIKHFDVEYDSDVDIELEAHLGKCIL